jgi:predicted extracellular nuclease
VRPSASLIRRLPLVVALLALAFGIPAAPTPARADTTPQPLPFSQNWSDAGLITTDDIWTGVPGITGYRGDGLTAGTSTNPQTILADGAATPVDVIANQSNPNTLTDGGVAEFDGIANPAIALQGSGTADAPHIVVALNTTGFVNINVQYQVRDIDGSADNEVQQVALHYRVAGSGDYINVPAGYIADATTGPSQATNIVNVNITLPPEANNQALLQLRIMTTNASTVDEWVAIDDISVTGTPSGEETDIAPSVTSTVPPSAGSTPPDSNLTITFSEPVTAAADAAALACNGAPVSFTGLPLVAPGSNQLVLNPVENLPFNASCTVTLTAGKIADVDGSVAHPLANDFTLAFTVLGETCPAGATLTPISAVQGAGLTTTLPTTQTVTIEGVVTALYDGLNGFYIQSKPGAEDSDPLSSEGLFIFTGNGGLPTGVVVGDTVRVDGRPGEFPTTGVASQTQLTSPTVTDCNISTAAPAPLDLALPFTALADLERYEGMHVRLAQELTISEYFNLDRFGEFSLALPFPGEGRLFQPTALVEPGPEAITRTNHNLLRRIIIDDGRSASNPNPALHPNGQPLSSAAPANLFRGGDTVTGLQGIVAQQFGTYRIQPISYGTYSAKNPRPTAPEPVGGTLRVSAMNTLNYFLTPDDGANLICGPAQDQECRGADADQAQEFTRQRTKILAAIQLLDPDVLGLIELENTPGVDPAADLAAGLNAALGAGTYASIDTGVIGGDAIRVGFIYKPGVVTPSGDFELLTTAVDPRFLDTKNRPVLAQTFSEVASGEKLTVAVAHLKSKGSDCNDVSDPDTGDGQGNCNLTRRNAALALVDWLATDPTGSGDGDFLIVGDLNSYAKEDPIDAILAGADDALGTADDYANLILRYQGYYAYSYLFDAQLGYLDHALASASLLPQVTGANELHINADEPDILDYDTSFKQAPQDALYEPNAYRAADHDPVLVGMDLGAVGPDPDEPGPGPVDPGPAPGPDPLPEDPKPFKLRIPMAAK